MFLIQMHWAFEKHGYKIDQQQDPFVWWIFHWETEICVIGIRYLTYDKQILTWNR
jgi:hypothetical protein